MRCEKYMFKNKLQKTLLIICAWIILSPAVCFAEGILPPETGNPVPCNSSNCGNYSLNDFLSLAANVADLILGFVGALALLFFVYGGFVFILSGGSEEKVRLGKQILINAIIGLVIVFASYMIIQFSMTLLGVTGFKSGTSGLTDFLGYFSKKK